MAAAPTNLPELPDFNALFWVTPLHSQMPIMPCVAKGSKGFGVHYPGEREIRWVQHFQICIVPVSAEGLEDDD